MAVADYGGRSCPHQHHWQPLGQDAGVAGGESLLLPEEGTVLPGRDQGIPTHLAVVVAVAACSIILALQLYATVGLTDITM